MQTALRLVAPYGTAFQTTMSPLPGAPMEVWLMHDTAKAGEVVEWLRNVITEYENQLQQLAKAQVMAQQSAALAQAQQAAAQAQPQPVHNEPNKAVPAVTPAVATAPKMHDWGGPYKLHKACRKCGVVATGFEAACK